MPITSADYFTYELPAERIAQRPLGRGMSKLLAAGVDGSIRDCAFAEFPDFVSSGDVLVLNKSRVLPARFYTTVGDAGKEVEILLVRQVPDAGTASAKSQRWEALARPMRALAMGTEVSLSDHVRAWVCGRTEDDSRILLQLEVSGSTRRLDLVLADEGNMPIPPYIRGGLSDEADREQYQTIFAEDDGSIAAPTAGLHFSDAIVEAVRAKGVEIVYVTHHVGPGSFQPVRERWQEHRMSGELSSVPLDVVLAIRRAKEAGKQVFVVGTTSVRALESAAASGELRPTNGFKETQLFITPGYRFRVVDRLLTNFHQPKTTHLLLVAAFAGEKVIEAAYGHALAGDYRFLSYGDAMLLERAA